MIQDLSGSCCIKGTGESMTRVDSSVPLMHHDPADLILGDPGATSWDDAIFSGERHFWRESLFQGLKTLK